MAVVPWRWEETRPLIEEGLPYSFLQGGVGFVYQGRGGTVGAGETRCALIMGILDSPWEKGMVLWATASIGRWFLIGGMGLGVFQWRGRYTDVRPLVKARDESPTWCENRDGNEACRRAVAGFPRRRSPSDPLYIRRIASGWMDGHNSYNVVGRSHGSHFTRNHKTTQPCTAVLHYQSWGRRGMLAIFVQSYCTLGKLLLCQ